MLFHEHFIALFIFRSLDLVRQLASQAFYKSNKKTIITTVFWNSIHYNDNFTVSSSAPACLSLPLLTSVPPQVLHLLATSPAPPPVARPRPVPASDLWLLRRLSPSQHLLPLSCQPHRLTAKKVRARVKKKYNINSR